MLLVQVSAVELALSVSVIMCSMPFMIFDNQSFPLGYCTMCGFLISFLRPVALWTLCGLNCDRYYAISAPLHYGSLINSRKVLISMSVTWISSLILGLPTIFANATYKYDNAAFICTPRFGRTFSVYYSLVYTIVVFILPLILILTCNMKVFTIARYHKHRIASAIFEVTLSAQVTITHQKNPFSPSGLANRFKGRSALLTVFQLIGSFLIIYVPYYGTLLWNSTRFILSSSATSAVVHDMHHRYDNDEETNVVYTINNFDNAELPHYFVSVASMLLFCSSSVNGILYGVKNRVLKKSFQNYWRKKMTKNELNQEIQARTPSTCGSRRPSFTPAIGFLARQTIRRPSEVSVDVIQKSNLLPTPYARFHSINNNFSSCRPGSSPVLESSAVQYESFNELKRTRSFRVNTNRINSLTNLKFCNNQSQTRIDDDLYNYEKHVNPSVTSVTLQPKNKQSLLIGGNGTNLFLQRFKKIGVSDYEALHKLSSKSPKILITRAYSEENDSTKENRSILSKTSSSVTTLLTDTPWNSALGDYSSLKMPSSSRSTNDYTDESYSDESQEHLFHKSNDKQTENKSDMKINTKKEQFDSHTNQTVRLPSFTSYHFVQPKENIQFHIGSVNSEDTDIDAD